MEANKKRTAMKRIGAIAALTVSSAIVVNANNTTTNFDFSKTTKNEKKPATELPQFVKEQKSSDSFAYAQYGNYSQYSNYSVYSNYSAGKNPHANYGQHTNYGQYGNYSQYARAIG